ncbi:hypothetical protein [uncultured Nostoc sp.]|uniref:hypothetical protein n=1 Tax=uncultured Nostoc sp. TaxID=340711 RepID=UPI0035CAF811
MRFFKIHLTLTAALLLVLCIDKVALAGGGETTPAAETSGTLPLTSNNETTVSTSSSINQQQTVGTSSSVSQQTGVIQFNNSGLSALTYPNCGGACIFAIGRAVPLSNGITSWETVAGVVWQLSSPDKTQAEANKMIAETQSENLAQESNLVLAEKLADAIESGKQERANILAILLSKRLGYSDYLRLLREMKAK